MTTSPLLCREPLATLHARFLELLPKIETHGSIYFRHLRCSQQRADAIQEMCALGWKWFVRLVECGKDASAFLVTFCRLLARAVRSGRRLAGMERAKEVLSPLAQQRQDFFVQRLPQFDTCLEDNPALEALRDNTLTPPPEQVAFRLDFPAWKRTRTERDRRVIKDLMLGERTMDVARKFGLTPARISQLRRDFHDDWLRFCADVDEQATVA